MYDHTTVAEYFKGFFTKNYDGGFGWPQDIVGREDFDRLTYGRIIWTQVHGDFKDAAKRALFNPYPYWPELHKACRDVIREHAKLETEFSGPDTCARIMRDAMKVLRARHGVNTPRWWLPLMDQIAGRDRQEQPAKSTRRTKMELHDGKVLYYPSGK